MKTAMSSRITSLLALALAAVMMLTLVGCNIDSLLDQLEGVEGDVSTTTTTTTTSGDEVTDPTAEQPEVSDTDATDPTGTTGSNPVFTRVTSTTKTNKTSTTTTAYQVSGKEFDFKNVPSSLKGTSITMLVWWNPGKEDAKTADQNKRREFEQNTGIKIKYVEEDMKDYQTKLSAMSMAGNAPAIAAIINEWYPQPITRGLMQPVTNVKGWDFTDEDVYAVSLMDQFGYKGVHYGINLKTSTNCTFFVMFYNKDLLKQNGVKEDPYTLWKAGKWNWDSCLNIAKKCTNDKKGIKGLSNVGQYYWMLSAGQDYVKSTKAGLKSNVSSTDLQKAWEWNWDMINTHKVVDTSYTGQTPFYQGKAAMLGIGSFAMQYGEGKTTYVPQAMKDDWSVVPFPSPAGKTYAACDGTVWGFPAKVKDNNKLQAAAWYLRYYLDEFNNKYVRENFYDPTHPECWEVMDWMWDQKIQSNNSVGVLTYGGEYTAYSIQYSLLDEADTKAKLKSNLESWKSVLESNIKKIESELG